MNNIVDMSGPIKEAANEIHVWNIDYFMESAHIRYLRMSC